MARDITIPSFQIAAACGSYDEKPMLPNDIDLQVHLSKNDRPQPFWLICEHDTVIASISGEGKIEFKDTEVNYHTYETGDFVYVPAGAPTRIVPDTQSVQYRYKPTDAGLEGVAWYCERCGNELYREVWDTSEEIPQAAYHRITSKFSKDSSLRECGVCGEKHPEIDTADLGWEKIAGELSGA